jgi:hypothetical protein
MGAELLNGRLKGKRNEIYTASDILKTEVKVINLAETEGFNEIYIGEMNF